MSIRDDILTTLQQQSHALSLSELLSYHPNLTKRTAQRWLNQLIQENKVIPEGNARARRYRLTNTQNTDIGQDNFPSGIPLSAEGKNALTHINQPLLARKPVGYNHDFLEAYTPNKSFYLTTPIRRQLHNMGSTHPSDAPVGTYAKTILQRLLIDLSWASSQLEGNTYSRLDTQKLIEHAQVAPGKAAMETQMILNHKSAIELLVDHAEHVTFNRYSLLNLHSTLSENLLPNPADEGRIRRHAVEIGQSTYRPLENTHHIEETLALLLQKAAVIKDPFEQSFFMMVHLPYLQPFADVNKRTSRLMANLPLLRENLCPLTFLDVPETAYSRAILSVYETNNIALLRDLYLWAYERSTQEYIITKRNMSEPDPLRLTYREAIRHIVYKIVTHPELTETTLLPTLLTEHVKQEDQEAVSALVTEELKRLHEGMLIKYGLTTEQLQKWQQKC